MRRYFRVSSHFAFAAVARRTLSILFVTAIALMGTVNPVSAFTLDNYSVDLLLEPPGLSDTTASGINDAGRIVGAANASDAPGTVALYWASRAAAPKLLPTGGFSDTSAYDINNAGQIVGVGTSAGTGSVALLWPSPTAAPTPLSTVGDQTVARGINDAGQIVGLTVAEGGSVRALFWATPGASPTLLPDLQGGLSSWSYGINNAGQIVGIAVGPDEQFGGDRVLSVFWASPSASPTELPRMSSAIRPGELALGINDLGQIVGRSNDQTPMLWANPTATPVQVPALGRGFAGGINNTGVIVGRTNDNKIGPTIWTPVQTSVLFLHGQGTLLSLDSNAPGNITAASRDSAALSVARGNPWKTIATWTQSPVGETRTLIGMGPMDAWIGLKNSHDQGTRFDVRADLLKNGVSIQSGEIYCLEGATRDPREALHIGGFDILSPRVIDEVKLAPTDTLSLRISTRIGTDGTGRFCGGHANATGLRFYFDAVDRQSRIAIDFKSK